MSDLDERRQAVLMELLDGIASCARANKGESALAMAQAIDVLRKPILRGDGVVGRAR